MRHALPESLNVLVVDDNATNREIVEAYLIAPGLRCETAASGTDALSAMHAAARLGEPFELVVLDGQMPGMDGIELAQAISLAPSLRGARLVMLTSTTDRRVAAREAGIDHYLQKPVRRRRLLEVVAEAMGAAAEPAGPSRSRPGDPETTHQDTLLVVEDNAVNQRVIEAMLGKRGFAVEVATNGREALTMLSVRSYPLVFMDCQMPEMDGYAATAAIRSRETGTTRLPIVAMTAHAMKGDRERCLAAGMDDYLVQAAAPGGARRGARALAGHRCPRRRRPEVARARRRPVPGARRRRAHARLPRRLSRDRRSADRALRGEHAAAAGRAARRRRERRQRGRAPRRAQAQGQLPEHRRGLHGRAWPTTSSRAAPPTRRSWPGSSASSRTRATRCAPRCWSRAHDDVAAPRADRRGGGRGHARAPRGEPLLRVRAALPRARVPVARSRDRARRPGPALRALRGRSARATIGRSSEVIGHTLDEVIAPDRVGRAAPGRRSGARGRAGARRLGRPALRAGTSAIDVVPFREHGAKVDHAMLAVRDITDEIALQRTIEDQRGFFSAVLSQLGDRISVCDADGVLISFGTPPSSEVGDLHPLEWAEHFGMRHPDGQPFGPHEAPLLRALRGDVVRDVELHVDTPDGTVSLLAGGGPVTTPEGRRLGAVVVTADLTAFRDAEGRLRRSEERHRRVVESMVDCVFETDELGRWTHLSENWTAATGHRVEDSLGRSSIEFVHPDDHGRFAQAFAPMLAGEQLDGRVGHRFVTTGGAERWAEVQVRAISGWDGLPTGFAGVMRDVTDEHRARQHANAEGALMRLLSAATDLEDVGEGLIEALAHELGWDGAELWRMSDDELLRRTSTWTAPGIRLDRFIEAGAGVGFEVGDGLPGQSWMSRVPLWRSSVAGEPDGIRSAAALPVRIRRHAGRGRRARLAHGARARAGARPPARGDRRPCHAVRAPPRRRAPRGRAGRGSQEAVRRRARARRAVRPLRCPDDADPRGARRHRGLLGGVVGADRHGPGARGHGRHGRRAAGHDLPARRALGDRRRVPHRRPRVHLRCAR